MALKHTPGPWIKCGTAIQTDSPEKFVASIGRTQDVEAHANGTLIAAAPELLKALDSAPIYRLDESPEQFIERYRAWYRSVRARALRIIEELK